MKPREMGPKELEGMRCGVTWGHPNELSGITNHQARRLFDHIDSLLEQLRRSAMVCPEEGCMLWRGHASEHLTKEQLEMLLVPKREKGPLPCGCHCAGGCGDPFAACMRPCKEHVPF